MTDESAAPARTRSREQLLRLLHNDPSAVSRAEIKAAFADGRLGDQDLDIPVLAGMRRITELLAELQPDGATGTDVGVGPGPTSVSTGAPRAASSSARLAEVEERLARLEATLAAMTASPSPTTAEVDDLHASLDRAEATAKEHDHRLRQLSLLALVSLGVAILAVVLVLLLR